MEAFRESGYLSLSGIQHFSFCPRQWALIHVEQLWEENILTFQGQEMHQKTNNPFVREKRGDTIIARAVPIISHRLRLYGIADVIEFTRGNKGIILEGRRGFWWPIPIEYKVGSPKRGNWDAVQLCAQAICLEEMFNISLENGAIFYGKTRKRLDVNLSDALREETMRIAKQMHETFDAGITPPADYSSKCDKCSLVDLCVPILSERKNVNHYLRHSIENLT